MMCQVDLGAELDRVNAWRLGPNQRKQIEQQQISKLKTALKKLVFGAGTLLIIVQMGDLQVCSWFGVLKSLESKLLLWTSLIDSRFFEISSWISISCPCINQQSPSCRQDSVSKESQICLRPTAKRQGRELSVFQMSRRIGVPSKIWSSVMFRLCGSALKKIYSGSDYKTMNWLLPARATETGKQIGHFRFRERTFQWKPSYSISIPYTALEKNFHVLLLYCARTKRLKHAQMAKRLNGETKEEGQRASVSKTTNDWNKNL